PATRLKHADPLPEIDAEKEQSSSVAHWVMEQENGSAAFVAACQKGKQHYPWAAHESGLNVI
ncbi:MAG: hypothetical protein ACI83P_002149, partial [Janthinobacterium sp.]